MTPARLARPRRSWGVALAVAIGVAGCGSSSKKNTSTAAATAPTPLTLSISDVGKTSKFTGPASVKGGLVTVTLTNNAKGLHGAQLLRLEGGHTIEEGVKALANESHKTPDWLRAEGGVGGAPPGLSSSATVSLPAGKYAVADFASESQGPPVIAPLTVTTGPTAALPVAGTVITGANPSKDRYKWEITGALKTGSNPITFVSKGESALHELDTVRITKDVPTATIVKDLQSNGPPPGYVDASTSSSVAVLDGGKSLNTQLILLKPGKYVFLCHLTDRDGGKPHFAEGMITTVTVK